MEGLTIGTSTVSRNIQDESPPQGAGLLENSRSKGDISYPLTAVVLEYGYLGWGLTPRMTARQQVR